MQPTNKGYRIFFLTNVRTKRLYSSTFQICYQSRKLPNWTQISEYHLETFNILIALSNVLLYLYRNYLKLDLNYWCGDWIKIKFKVYHLKSFSNVNLVSEKHGYTQSWNMYNVYEWIVHCEYILYIHSVYILYLFMAKSQIYNFGTVIPHLSQGLRSWFIYSISMNGLLWVHFGINILSIRSTLMHSIYIYVLI